MDEVAGAVNVGPQGELFPAPAETLQAAAREFQHPLSSPGDIFEEGLVDVAQGDEVVATVAGGPEHRPGCFLRGARTASCADLRPRSRDSRFRPAPPLDVPRAPSAGHGACDCPGPPPRCVRSPAPNSSARARRNASGPGAHQSVSGPRSASTARSRVRRVIRAASSAARRAPRTGIRRVLVRPGTGARVKTLTGTDGSGSARSDKSVLSSGSRRGGDAPGPRPARMRNAGTTSAERSSVSRRAANGGWKSRRAHAGRPAVPGGAASG